MCQVFGMKLHTCTFDFIGRWQIIITVKLLLLTIETASVPLLIFAQRNQAVKEIRKCFHVL